MTPASPQVRVTRCDEVRLPDRGVGEADFDVNAAEKLLGIHFSDTRNGEYRNMSYTVEYFDDPSCRTTVEVAELISRVSPPGWPPLVLGPRGAGPLRLGMSHQEIAHTGAATTPLGSQHDGWPPGCRILRYRGPRLGRVPGETLNGTVSPDHGLEQMYATRRMVTPQGIRIGSTIDDVRTAYDRPGVTTGDSVIVRVSNRAVYRIQIGRVVTSIALELHRLNCTR